MAEPIGPKILWASHDPRKGLWLIKILKICLQQNSIFIKLKNPQTFYKIRDILNLYLQCTQAENVHN